jgi:hypothetical protein
VASAGPAGGGGGGRQAGNRGALALRSSDLVFGCFGTDYGPHVHRWTAPYRDQGPALSLVPGHQAVQHLPVLLGQNWKTVDCNWSSWSLRHSAGSSSSALTRSTEICRNQTPVCYGLNEREMVGRGRNTNREVC